MRRHTGGGREAAAADVIIYGGGVSMLAGRLQELMKGKQSMSIAVAGAHALASAML